MYKEITIYPTAVLSRYLQAGLTLKDSEQKETCPICKSKDIFPITQLINNQIKILLKDLFARYVVINFFQDLHQKNGIQIFMLLSGTIPEKINEIPVFDYSPVSDFLLEKINYKSNILDLGYGYGTAMKHFKSLGFKNVFELILKKRIEVASSFDLM